MFIVKLKLCIMQFVQETLTPNGYLQEIMSMLQLSGVNLWFNDSHVIKDLSFQVQQGEIVSLLGPSGCGKTTVLRLIAGLEKPWSGCISLANEVISSKELILEPHKREIGFLFQDYALFPHLTVAQNVGWGLSGYNKKRTQKRTREMLKNIRMIEHENKYPHELSGGEQQRVALARARAPDPNLILLDEPFSGLDTTLRNTIREETNSMLRQQGATVVMVTHDPDEAMLMADRIVLMNEGRVMQIGTPGEIYSFPTSIFAASFFGEVNHFSGNVASNQVQTIAGFFPNQKHKNGCEVDVVIRPDAIKLGALDSDSAIKKEVYVCSVKYTGRFSYVWVAFDEAAEPEKYILVRQSGCFNKRVGMKLHLNVSKNDIFLFAKNSN
ncbi:MAG: Fe(3+) ions import ATP-binding protein FbpC [Alphaproteobacteria bacterium MarineAlpha3_Bin5]|nr:MAG: Fe(3+) ions import ATP-binding protein FbpC [Alphaproteobacteria bacterium MarineAlpha3_Bin5]